MSKETGGPAFPVPGDAMDGEEGLAMRDYFAAKAMNGIIASWTHGMPPAEETAQGAYRYADAMLKAREQ